MTEPDSTEPIEPDPGGQSPEIGEVAHGDRSGGPHHQLAAALARMRWVEEPGRFVLVGVRGAPAPEDLLLLERAPAQLVREEGETTLLVRAEALPELQERHPGLRHEGPLAWIRFEAPMAWDLVGFLAHVSGALAAAEVPIGVVCSFDRDHLFVAEAWLERVRAVLDGLFGRPD